MGIMRYHQHLKRPSVSMNKIVPHASLAQITLSKILQGGGATSRTGPSVGLDW